MFKKIYEFLSPGFFPFSLSILLGVFIILYRLFDLPSPAVLSQYIIDWYREYGLMIVLVCAIVEALFMLGIYFPGSLAILLAVFSLGDSYKNLVIIGGLAIAGFTVANVINYYLGQFGYYRVLLLFGQQEVVERMRDRLEKNWVRTTFLSAFHPNFLAITMVCLGISKTGIMKSIGVSVAALLFWVTLWTVIVAAFVRNVNIQDSNQTIYLLVLFILWGVVLAIKEHFWPKPPLGKAAG